MYVEAAGHSDVGRVRSQNEDRFAIQRDLPDAAVLCVLADGMGGHDAGDVAATVAVAETLAAITAGADVAGAVARANAAVHARSAEAGGRGMGTTLTCALLRQDAVRFAHVGDSRLYLLRAGELRQLSHDHSWVAEQVAAGHLTAAEARRSSQRHLVTRALGFDAVVAADVGEHALSAGDTLLLCSDGVHGVVSEAELATACALPVAEAAAAIVDLANGHGGADNATAVVARLHPSDDDGRGVTRPLPDMRPTMALSASAMPLLGSPAGAAAGRRTLPRFVVLIVLGILAALLLALVWSGVMGVYL